MEKDLLMVDIPRPQHTTAASMTELKHLMVFSVFMMCSYASLCHLIMKDE